MLFVLLCIYLLYDYTNFLKEEEAALRRKKRKLTKMRTLSTKDIPEVQEWKKKMDEKFGPLDSEDIEIRY